MPSEEPRQPDSIPSGNPSRRLSDTEIQIRIIAALRELFTPRLCQIPPQVIPPPGITSLPVRPSRPRRSPTSPVAPVQRRPARASRPAAESRSEPPEETVSPPVEEVEAQAVFERPPSPLALPEAIEAIDPLLADIERFLCELHGAHPFLERVSLIKGETARLAFKEKLGPAGYVVDVMQGRSMFTAVRFESGVTRIIHLEDQIILNSVNGAVEERHVSVEELSHCCFSFDQELRGHPEPDSVFTELIAVFDKLAYFNNRIAAPSNREGQRVLDSVTEIGREEKLKEPHYRLAHRWGHYLWVFMSHLAHFRGHDEAVAFLTTFYRGSDQDRLRTLLNLNQLRTQYELNELTPFVIFDPGDAMEQQAYPAFRTRVQM